MSNTFIATRDKLVPFNNQSPIKYRYSFWSSGMTEINTAETEKTQAYKPQSLLVSNYCNDIQSAVIYRPVPYPFQEHEHKEYIP